MSGLSGSGEKIESESEVRSCGTFCWSEVVYRVR
jgi:hypothetical protein